MIPRILAAIMAVTQADIDKLNEALASGVRSVTIGGQTVTYSTVDALITARDDLKRQLDAQQQRRRKRQTYLYQDGRGYE